MTKTFIDAGDVADLLGLSSRAAFLRKHDQLQRDYGFPVPMPHSVQPLLWRRSQVLAWIEENGQRAQARQMPRQDGTNLVLLNEAART